MYQPKVTIVTPTYNRADLLSETIESILNQTYQDFEYIIIDDGSTDNTRELVAQYGDRIRYLYHENCGEAASTNRGWKEARGEYFAMVSSDDPMLPPWLEVAVNFMEQNQEILVAYPDWVMIDSQSRPIKIHRSIEYAPERIFGWLHCLPGPGTIIRRNSLSDLEDIRREKYGLMSDFDNFLTLALRGKFSRIPYILATWRRHNNSTSLAIRSRQRIHQLHELIKETYKNPIFPPELRALKRVADSRKYYLSAAISGPTSKLKAVYYYACSKIIMPTDPVGMPIELRRRPLFSPRYIGREIAWGLRRYIINYYRPPTSMPYQRAAKDVYNCKLLVDDGPLVSVIIPTLNRKDLTVQAIKSVTAQSYRNIEIIVIDNGSNDGTAQAVLDLCHKDKRIKLEHASKRGASNARNVGLDLAKGEFIAFLDSDDTYDKDKIAISVARLLDNPEASFVHTYWVDTWIDKTNAYIVRPFLQGDATHDLLMFTPIATPTVVARREAIERAGRFDENLTLAEDYDYFARLALNGYAELIEQPLTLVGHHSGNTIKNYDIIRDTQITIINRYFPYLKRRHPSAQRSIYQAHIHTYIMLRKAMTLRIIGALAEAFRAVKVLLSYPGRYST